MSTRFLVPRLLLLICAMLPMVRSKLTPAAFAAAPSPLSFHSSSARSVGSTAARAAGPRVSFPGQARLPIEGSFMQLKSARHLSMNSAATTTAQTTAEDKIKVLYDGECPICLYEIQWLEKRAEKRGITDLEFIDVADKDYTPDKCAGISYEKGMEVMHVVGKDGTIHDSVSAFEVLYGAVGLSWLANALGNPSFQKVANPVYDFWAKLRLPLTGRPSLEVLLARRKANEVGCRDEVCAKK